MKITYLMNKTQADGSIQLSIVTHEEWLAVVKANKQLPLERQRYFIRDYIADGSDMDWIIIETSREDYLAWHREQTASERNRTWVQTFQKLSLDAEVSIEDGTTTLHDVISDANCIEENCCSQLWVEDLRMALKGWKPWANDLLDMYLQGKGRSCTELLSKKYSVSPQVIRKYKRQLEEFVKKFFEGVSF